MECCLGKRLAEYFRSDLMNAGYIRGSVHETVGNGPRHALNQSVGHAKHGDGIDLPELTTALITRLIGMDLDLSLSPSPSPSAPHPAPLPPSLSGLPSLAPLHPLILERHLSILTPDSYTHASTHTQIFSAPSSNTTTQPGAASNEQHGQAHIREAQHTASTHTDE